ncbi:unnamed protein product [Moneuplotes crassus]|uniref:Uncharacterized protein n=1 Tax=Euplotes crassus TaxID=5936 RepID=A0AAD1US01_EUPCR|nr:unnamed protein product [Moneuplotes crassus]
MCLITKHTSFNTNKSLKQYGNSRLREMLPESLDYHRFKLKEFSKAYKITEAEKSNSPKFLHKSQNHLDGMAEATPKDYTKIASPFPWISTKEFSVDRFHTNSQERNQTSSNMASHSMSKSMEKLKKIYKINKIRKNTRGHVKSRRYKSKRELSLDSQEENDLRAQLFDYANSKPELPSIEASMDLRKLSHFDLRTPAIKQSSSKRSFHSKRINCSTRAFSMKTKQSIRKR